MGNSPSLSKCKTSEDFFNFLEKFKWKEEHKTSEFVDLLVSKGKEFIQDANGAEKFGAIFVESRGFDCGKNSLFTTKGVYEVLIDHCFSKYATTPDSVEQLGFAISNIAYNNPEARRLFSTTEAATAIINALSMTSSTSESVAYLGAAIGNIIDENEEGKRLFSTPEATSAIINAMQKYATTPDSVGYISLAIGALADSNPERQRLFSTQEVASCFLNAFQYATVDTSVHCLCLGIKRVIDNNEQGTKIFANTPHFIDELKSLGKYYEKSKRPRARFDICVELLTSAVIVPTESEPTTEQDVVATEAETEEQQQ